MSHEDELQYRAGCDDPEKDGSDMVTAAKYIYYEVKNGPRYWIESGPGLVARCYTREDAEIVCKALNILETLLKASK